MISSIKSQLYWERWRGINIRKIEYIISEGQCLLKWNHDTNGGFLAPRQVCDGEMFGHILAEERAGTSAGREPSPGLWVDMIFWGPPPSCVRSSLRRVDDIS